MDRQFPVVTIASCFALAAFAVAVFAGLAADRAAADVLASALIAMTVCYLVGIGAARIAEVALREHVAMAHATVANDTSDTSGAAGADVDIIGDLVETDVARARSD